MNLIIWNVCRESFADDVLVQKTWKDIGPNINKGKKTYYTINSDVYTVCNMYTIMFLISETKYLRRRNLGERFEL